MLDRHTPILGSRLFHWSDEAGCAAFARALAGRPALADATIALAGDLGAGKTTFARHLLRALGVGGPIKSPTYAVLERYELPSLTVSHLDFYRFDDPREAGDAGLRELFAAPGLKLVEWPDKAGDAVPAADLRLTITVADDGARAVRADAATARGLALIA